MPRCCGGGFASTHETYAIVSEIRSEYERIHDLDRDRTASAPTVSLCCPSARAYQRPA